MATSERAPAAPLLSLDEALARLAADLEDRMRRLGFPREDRPFSAHVTVGRVKDGSGAGEILAAGRPGECGSSLVREVVLYESVMKSNGSEYTALHRAALDAPPYKAERQTREVEVEGSDSED